MLETILIIAFGGAIISYFIGKISSQLRNLFAISIWISIIGMISYLYFAKPTSKVFYPGFLGFDLVLRINALSWLFVIAVAFIGVLSILFSFSYIQERKRTNFYYLMMLLVHGGMLGVVLSGDFLSFYIFWEIMSWSTFLLISYNRGPALGAGMKYIVMSIIGSGAMLIGIVSLYANYATLTLDKLPAEIASASPEYILFILFIFFISFGIKNAVVPLHTWLPDSYAESPSPFTAVLSAMLTRMGIYGFLLIMYVIVGTTATLSLGPRLLEFHHILAWLGAITIVIPTFIALLQNDAKQLLAWHGIGQGGYMIVGIAIGTSLGVAGGIFHTFNHAIYISLLFLTVGAVQYRTGGVRDLNSLGGLIKKMPIAFIGGLVGISGLIGIPLTNGFASKWLIYKTLVLDGYPFLAFAAFIGTWGTILSVYKFLHNMFLGQLPDQYKNIRRSPRTMQFPIIVLSITILVFGIFPGIPLSAINDMISSLGFNSLNVGIWGIISDTGTLNTINILIALVIAIGLVWYIFRVGPKARDVNQEDSYAAGATVPTNKYSYTAEFYDPLFKIIKPYLRDVVDDFYSSVVEFTAEFSNKIRKLYTGYVGTYVMYIITLVASLLFIQLGWNIW